MSTMYSTDWMCPQPCGHCHQLFCFWDISTSLLYIWIVDKGNKSTTCIAIVVPNCSLLCLLIINSAFLIVLAVQIQKLPYWDSSGCCTLFILHRKTAESNWSVFLVFPLLIKVYPLTLQMQVPKIFIALTGYPNVKLPYSMVAVVVLCLSCIESPSNLYFF